jgi:hypothetical protein
MEIRWGNIFAVLMIIFAIYLFFKAKPAIDRFFEDLEYMPMRHDHGMFALTIFAMILITAVAVIKIISNRKQ